MCFQLLWWERNIMLWFIRAGNQTSSKQDFCWGQEELNYLDLMIICTLEILQMPFGFTIGNIYFPFDHLSVFYCVLLWELEWVACLYSGATCWVVGNTFHCDFPYHNSVCCESVWGVYDLIQWHLQVELSWCVNLMTYWMNSSIKIYICVFELLLFLYSNLIFLIDSYLPLNGIPPFLS